MPLYKDKRNFMLALKFLNLLMFLRLNILLELKYNQTLTNIKN